MWLRSPLAATIAPGGGHVAASPHPHTREILKTRIAVALRSLDTPARLGARRPRSSRILRRAGLVSLVDCPIGSRPGFRGVRQRIRTSGFECSPTGGLGIDSNLLGVEISRGDPRGLLNFQGRKS